METQEAIDQSPIPYWESIASMTRCGGYISAIEEGGIRLALALAGPPTTALEVGCEGGRWSRMLADLGWRVTCTDINPESLRFCQQRLPDATCTLVRPEDTRLPCEVESMDLLLCIEVSSVPLYDWIKEEAARVLRPGGLYVGTFWNRRSYRGLKHLFASTGLDYYAHSYPLWKADMRARGFTFLHEEGYCWPPFRRDSNSPLVPAAARIERAIGLHRLPDVSPWVLFIVRKKRRQSE